jgi:tetratricopeptide (TPR) repeat protein
MNANNKTFAAIKNVANKTTMLAALIVVASLIATSAHSHGNQHVSGEQLGTVNFPVSCNEQASKHITKGVALLHHMTYEDAKEAFTHAAKSDANCAMGYWGQAMTLIHPLWSDPPSKAKFEQGAVLVSKAKSIGQRTERENAYIDALEAYFNEGRQSSEKINLASFEKGWEKVYQQFPDDLEAASFYALSQLAMVDPSDKSYVKQKQAGAIAEMVVMKNPDHPGAHHYVIHAYDYPALSNKALQVARGYGKIAPDIPHALHMPTHIFTRLGQWKDSINMNSRSAAAALNNPVGDKISLHYAHALDYLAYAHLQRGEDTKAQKVLTTLNTVNKDLQTHIATAYTLAAVPARLVLERRQWSDAVALEPRTPSDFPWDKFPAAEAITHFTRALGAAHSGNKVVAEDAIKNMERLQQQAAKTSSYWAKQVEIQKITAQAWIKYQGGDKAKGFKIMRMAAHLEAKTEKHPVTPGEVLPARELLADMLLDMGRYQQAQSEYEAALKRSANRFNSLYGAAYAAELTGNKTKATHYYKKLTEITASDAKLDQLMTARDYLANN